MNNMVSDVVVRGHSLVLQIRELFKSNLSTEMLTLKNIAARLYMSSQTLRRHLASVGITFQKLKDELRCDIAMDLLKLPELAIEDVAEKVGFSEQSTFYRAFKKWTGVTPGDYRRQHCYQ